MPVFCVKKFEGYKKKKNKKMKTWELVNWKYSYERRIGELWKENIFDVTVYCKVKVFLSDFLFFMKCLSYVVCNMYSVYTIYIIHLSCAIGWNIFFYRYLYLRFLVSYQFSLIFSANSLRCSLLLLLLYCCCCDKPFNFIFIRKIKENSSIHVAYVNKLSPLFW